MLKVCNAFQNWELRQPQKLILHTSIGQKAGDKSQQQTFCEVMLDTKRELHSQTML